VAQLVLLRAANVGGNTFRPSELARKLSRWQVTSLGAAGTFVVGAPVGASTVVAEFRRLLPFEAEVMTLSGSELESLLRLDPLGGRAPEEGVRRFLSASSRLLSEPSGLPLHFPSVANWQVVLTGVTGRLAYGYRRRTEERLLYPNEAMEKRFHQPFTTRWWETLEQAQLRMRAGVAKPPARRPRSRA
jgi:hypothetical protein